MRLVFSALVTMAFPLNLWIIVNVLVEVTELVTTKNDQESNGAGK